MSVIDNWFKKRFMKMSAQSQNAQSSMASTGASKLSMSRDNDIGLTIRTAHGGRVVEYTHFDAVKDTRISETHIIVDGEDLGARLSQIITFEALKQ